MERQKIRLDLVNKNMKKVKKKRIKNKKIKQKILKQIKTVNVFWRK